VSQKVLYTPEEDEIVNITIRGFRSGKGFDREGGGRSKGQTAQLGTEVENVRIPPQSAWEKGPTATVMLGERRSVTKKVCSKTAAKAKE